MLYDANHICLTYTDDQGHKKNIMKCYGNAVDKVFYKHEEVFTAVGNAIRDKGGIRDRFVGGVVLDYLFDYNESVYLNDNLLVELSDGKINSYLGQLIHEYKNPQEIVKLCEQLYERKKGEILDAVSSGEDVNDLTSDFYYTEGI